MDDISVDNIIEIHEYAILRFGGLPGTRDKATLEYLIFELGKEEDPIKKAALVLHTIATRHPFMDGNMRTAFMAANNQISQYGYLIKTSNGEVFQFVVLVADNQKTLKDVEKWIRRYLMAI